MRLAGYILLFVLIQAASLVLTLLGVPIVGALAMVKAWVPGDALTHHWRYSWAWIWDNEIDGIDGQVSQPTRWSAFYWSALRNPCNNLRFVKGVSAVGRPLWRKTWGTKPGGFYCSAGWNNSGYPVLSGGRNVNPY